MNKNPLEIVYKTLYNHFIKLDGFHPKTHVIAACGVGLFVMLFFINSFVFITLISNQSFSMKTDKTTEWVSGIFIMVLNYYFLFNIFKFSKNGDSMGYRFKLEKKESSLAWIMLVVNLLLLFILSGIRKFIL